MKETGIMMSGDHPRLILERRKTMTRRTWGLEQINKKPDYWIYEHQYEWFRHYDDDGLSAHTLVVKCPYGQVGDRLWVRETFSDIIFQVSNSHSADYIYKAEWDKPLPYNGKWKSPRFMPRWASRITPEITEVRVERLQEINPEDCVAEGIIDRGLPITGFSLLWDILNAKRGYSWESNPWVWVISFEKK